MKIEFPAQHRTVHGSSSSRRLRRSGKVPGVLYGGNEPTVAIEMDHQAMLRHLAKEAFHASILTIQLEQKPIKVLLRHVQPHPYRKQVLHMDFQRVDENRAINIKVPLHFINAEQSPGVKQQGGIVSHVRTELEISCLPRHLPEFIQVDLKDLSIGHSLHISQLTLSEGVKAVVAQGTDPVVATILRSVAEEEPTAATAAAATTEAAAGATGADAAAADGKKPAAATDGKKAPEAKK